MALWQGKSKRKPSGGRLKLSRGKRKFEIGREKQFTRVGPESRKEYRTRGANTKVRLLSTEYANVMNCNNHTVTRAKIIKVKINPANPNYVQRNIINKGTTIETDIGDAVVTSRPGQSGAVDAILIE
ncbi:MAG: small subunit ribosomal protein S8e [Candidatus Methanomethylophilaceae archaeon]|jgi:small subunit ribosomal protein S8e|nr:30S ribosomal protein S8e [Methanothrix soehngenii]MDI3482275.1 small subunit ribosomal protein S8e [Candidatus Methanomethylophilaceae archaeon]MDI3541715.1 small subunit ribosomal protein S8e [Candidatus Methanomethylophilaceae archaeon]